MLKKFERFNEMISGWAEWIALFAICFMVALTCVDVIGAKIFRMPVPGSLDIVMLAQLIAATFAVAMALIKDRHVQVEFFMVLLPKRIQAVVDALIQLLLVVFFIVIVWRLFLHGVHLQSGGEQTATVRIPVAPFSYASAVAIIPVCLVFMQQFINSILRAMKNES